jgi:hypothetical protein
MRLSSARRALDKAVAAEGAAGADQRREEPGASMRNPHLKEAVN